MRTEEIFKKLVRFCAYQERCTDEVRRKLEQLGADARQEREVTDLLLEQGFLNEDRFARMYVRGKFRINGWGRIKIKNGLLAKRVPPELIRAALTEEIDEAEYRKFLQGILCRKGPKTALSKGFEPDLIREETKADGFFEE